LRLENFARFPPSPLVAGGVWRQMMLKHCSRFEMLLTGLKVSFCFGIEVFFT
jgi:hypothetical protein